MLRKAKTSDVKMMHRMINLSAAKGEMLPRSLVDLYNSLRDFYVYLEEDKGPIVGIVGMHLFWDNLAEIRSLYVSDDYRHKGIGKKLVEACISEAITLEIYRIFALTYQKDFFDSDGVPRGPAHGAAGEDLVGLLQVLEVSGFLRRVCDDHRVIAAFAAVLSFTC